MNFFQKWFVTDKVRDELLAEAKTELRVELKKEIFDETVEEITDMVKQEERLRLDEDAVTSLTLMFDENLQVTSKTNVNPVIVQTLLDQEYLPPELADDPEGIQMALILAGSEVLDQIIDETNEVAREYQSGD